jgi:hypothetical protein
MAVERIARLCIVLFVVSPALLVGFFVAGDA